MELFFNTNAPGFDKACATNLAKFRFTEADPEIHDFLGFLGCKAPIKWTYDLEWPLDLILNEADILAYSEIFSYLAGVRYIHVNLHRLSEITLKSPVWWAPFWRSKAMMGHFLDSFWSYIQVDILDPSYLALLSNLENPELAYDFDSIQGLHFNYIEHIRLATLMKSRLATFIYAILKTIDRFTVLSYVALENIESPPTNSELAYLGKVHAEFLVQMKFLFRSLSSLNSLPGRIAFKEKFVIFDGQETPEQTKRWDRACKTLEQLLLRLDYNRWFSLYL
ncbi:hypothetical protein DSO57_1020859 [Entomophthora muscae]|uniref:Uncharacterized protein n=1 Tax=Entomophthora muscae TaxID=34485 RepID=A0ACC2UNQ6_9FUNG|nr:hypothetical protein DSO57_1020859 [Entomophthora muscae]